jgi:hypothetical protein
MKPCIYAKQSIMPGQSVEMFHSDRFMVAYPKMSFYEREHIGVYFATRMNMAVDDDDGWLRVNKMLGFLSRQKIDPTICTTEDLMKLAMFFEDGMIAT